MSRFYILENSFLFIDDNNLINIFMIRFYSDLIFNSSIGYNLANIQQLLKWLVIKSISKRSNDNLIAIFQQDDDDQFNLMINSSIIIIQLILIVIINSWAEYHQNFCLREKLRKFMKMKTFEKFSFHHGRRRR